MWPFSSPQNDEDNTPPIADSAQMRLQSPLYSTSLRTTPNTAITQDTVVQQKPQSQFQFHGHAHERLGIPFETRFPFLILGSFITGFGLGVTTGGRKRADRFRAENSHRFPKTQAGWYLYHRSKSYNTIVGGVSEGIRFGGQLMIWAGLFGVVEEAMDRSRAKIFTRDEEETKDEQRDFMNTVTAGMSTVGCYIVFKRLDVFAAGKMARMALKWSLGYGLLQDAMNTLKGERPGYVQWATNRFKRLREHV